MYLNHFGLKRKPFDISPDPDFLWLGEKHREGLAILKYGILENKGFLLITGEVGTGKTALIRSIEREIDAHAIVVTIPDPGMSLMDFYNFLAAELKMDRGFNNKGEFLVRFKRLLIDAFSVYKRVLLIIDEAQRLDHTLLEEIRLLSNIDLGGKVLINIFFVGQSEFRTLLAREENRSVRQRITVSYHIAPLTPEETHQYIQHRLSVAGSNREIISAAAAKMVYHYSRGFPRLINIICDHALMTAYSQGAEKVGPETIKECAEELRITIGLEAPPPRNAPATAPATGAAQRPAPAAAATEPAPRRGRSAWIFALCLLAFALAWYIWQDPISELLARLGRPPERSALETAGAAPTEKRIKLAPAPEPAAAGETAAEKPLVAERSPSAGGATAGREPEPAARPLESAPAPKAAAAPEPPAPAPAPTPPAAQPPKAEAAAAPFPREFVVYFTQNSAEIPIYAQEVLSRAVALLKEHAQAEARIEGHSDALGNPILNQAISEARANAVRSYLLRSGIAPNRLNVFFYGSDRPVDSNDTPEGRSKNRRVVIRVNASPSAG